MHPYLDICKILYPTVKTTCDNIYKGRNNTFVRDKFSPLQGTLIQIVLFL